MAKTIDMTWLKTSAKQDGAEWFVTMSTDESPEVGDTVVVSPGKFGFTGEITRVGTPTTGIRAGREYSDVRVYLKKIAAN